MPNFHILCHLPSKQVHFIKTGEKSVIEMRFKTKACICNQLHISRRYQIICAKQTLKLIKLYYTEGTPSPTFCTAAIFRKMILLLPILKKNLKTQITKIKNN